MKAVTAALCLVSCTSVALAAEPTPVAGTARLDTRVASALESAGLAYADDDGDFRLIYQVGGGRSQAVWVASSTARITRLEYRDVWSLAYRGDGQVPLEMARRLLTENARMVLGAWQVNQAQDRYLVVFLAQLPADADAASLQEVVEAVALSTDRMEKELTSADEF
jgi:hypothetical protein